MVCSSMQNVTFSGGSRCCCWAKNSKCDRIWNICELPYLLLSTAQGEIWRRRVSLYSVICHIELHLDRCIVSSLWVRNIKRPILEYLGLPYPRLYRSGTHSAYDSEPVICSSMPKFALTGASCSPSATRNRKFDTISNFGLLCLYIHPLPIRERNLTCERTRVTFDMLFHAEFYIFHGENPKFDRIFKFDIF